MLRLLFVFGVLQCCLSQQYQDRVAPGVNPNQYQSGPPQQYQPPPPPPPQQQYQQPPPQQQQQYQQQQYQQQVPVQQMPVQQQVPVQQMPPSQHGGHGDPQILNPHISDERKHIEEHMDVPMDTSKMSEQELQFHYFKMHDADNNNKLDGCELIKSLIHWHENEGKDLEEKHPHQGGEKEENNPEKDGKEEIKLEEIKLEEIKLDEDGDKENKDDHKDSHEHGVIYTDEQLIALIDTFLADSDKNRDGYIDYVEFAAKLQAEEKRQQENKETTNQ